MPETPLRKQAENVHALLRSLLRELTTGMNDPAAGLPLAQLRVCGALCEGPRSMSAISRELGVSLSAVTQIADRLERARLVARVSQSGDRRVRCLQLTERGLRLMRVHDETRIERMAAVLSQMTVKARAEAIAGLEALVGGATRSRRQDGQPNDGPHFMNMNSKVLL